MSNLTLKVNGQLVNQIEQKVKVALESVGLAAEGYAKLECPVDTDNLRGSITHIVDGNRAVIGTNKEYAAYVEFGTGKYASNGGGTTKESWVYKDELGHWHKAYPQQPRPYLKPAITDHIDEYTRIVADALSN